MVQPPVGRFHQSLWEIAQQYLGDGRRYREIFELNSGLVQPDGSKLTSASLIRPGWVLHMPRDARGPGIEVVTTPAQPGTRARGPARHRRPSPAPPAARPGAARRARPGRAAGRPAARAHAGGQRTRPAAPGGTGRAGTGPGAGGQPAPARPGRRAAQPGAARGGQPRHRAGREPGAPRRPRTAAPPGGCSPPARPAPAPGRTRRPGSTRRPRQHRAPDAVPGYPHELAAAALLSSAVLAALGRRRREQLWQRAFGRRVLGPGPEPALAEAAMRSAADEPSTRAAGHRPALPVARTGPVLAHPAHRVRRPPQPGEPRPLGGPRGPGRAGAVDRGGRWAGVAAAGHRAAAGRAEGGQRGTAAVPRPGHHRHRRHRAGAGQPGRRARADLGHRPGARWSPPCCPRWPWSWPPTAGRTGCG